MTYTFKVTLLAFIFAGAPIVAQDNQELKLSHHAKQSCKALALTTGIALLSFVIFKEVTQFNTIKSYASLNIPAIVCTAAVGVYLSMHDYKIIRSEYRAIKTALQHYKEKHKQSRNAGLFKKELPYHGTFTF